jgi:minor histocompatibility antigen H13
LSLNPLLHGRKEAEDAAQAAYIGGLGVAFAVNALTHTGQPALLYLVPATLGAILLMAAARGEVSLVPYGALH